MTINTYTSPKDRFAYIGQGFTEVYAKPIHTRWMSQEGKDEWLRGFSEAAYYIKAFAAAVPMEPATGGVRFQEGLRAGLLSAWGF